jgi:acetyl esterase/lipase
MRAALWLCVLGAALRLGAAEDVVVRRDVEFLGAGRAEKLDLYLPAGPVGAARPALVWVHGGGWKTGDKAAARERNIGTTFARWGFVVASVNYRLGPGAWPTNLHDVKTAVRWLRAHAAELGVDPRRIVLGGGSAGGHLALLGAFTADREFEPADAPGGTSGVAAVLDFYGITDHRTRQQTDARGQETGRPHLGGADEVFGATRESLTATSPLAHVRAGLPPVFITHGLIDTTVNVGQSRELAAALAAAGVAHELVLLPEAGHTYDLDKWNGRALQTDLAGALRRFLERQLGPWPAPADRRATR